MKRPHRRGIFLISLLFIATVIAMFVASAIALAPGGLQNARVQARREAAERAVQSALQYAIARVRATPGGLWRAETPLTIQSDGMIVTEGDGQVVGWVREGEQWSRFRFSFNYQDGTGGADGLPNPSNPLSNFQVGVSCNNLRFSVEQPIPPRGDQGAADWSKPARFQLPAHCLLLGVEGSAGPVTLSGGVPTGFSSGVSSTAGEAVLQLDNVGLQGFDSVASATGELLFQVATGGEVAFRARGGGDARLRSKAGLSVTDAASGAANLTSPRGEIRTPQNGNEVTGNVAGNVGRAQENSSDQFYSIALNSTPQPKGTPVQMNAGVYEVDLVNGSPVVSYYAMNYADYKAQKLAGTLAPGQAVTLDSAITLQVADDGKVEMHFTSDAVTKVTDSALTDLAIVPSKGAFQEGETPAAPGVIQPAPGPGGGGQPQVAVSEYDYLGQLATRIQSQMSGGNPIINGNIASYTTTFPVDQTFTDLLDLYGTNNLNLPSGGAISWTNGQVKTANNYVTDWDGLPGAMNYQMGALRLAQYIWSNSGTPEQRAQIGQFVGSPPPTQFGVGAPPDYGFGGSNGPSPSPSPSSSGSPGPSSSPGISSAGSGLAVKDFRIKLERAAPNGTNYVGGVRQPVDAVTLRGKGIVLAGALEGHGGAVVTEGDLQLLGNGVNLSAAEDSANKINLYSTGDILIDGFAFDDSSSRYNDVSLKGVMYSWGNIRINVGNPQGQLAWGNFNLEGAMVAFGGDPGNTAGNQVARQISITAAHTDLAFDPVYLLNLEDSPVTADSSFTVRAYHQK